MRSWIAALLISTAVVTSSIPASASSLQIMPINVEVTAPGTVSKVTLTNTGSDKINAQIRIFKWVQINGKDELRETRDVVASPPALKLRGGKTSVIRIVRVSKTPAEHEESYRLVIDELPKPPKPGQTGVGFQIRYSVPVFFSKPGDDIDINWKAAVSSGNIVLTAANSGARRLRLADLTIVGRDGKNVSLGSGLSGYVLGQSSRKWVAKAKSIKAGSVIKIVAQGDNGPIEATATVQASN